MRRRTGFTLLEASVALLLVGAVALGTFGVLGAIRRGDAGVADALPAAAIAEERLALLALASAHELRALPDSLRRGTAAPPFDAYAWVASASLAPREPDLHDLAVVVTWPTGRFELRSRRYRPVMTAPGSRTP